MKSQSACDSNNRNLKAIGSHLQYMIIGGAPLFLISLLLLLLITIYVVPPYFNTNSFTQTTCKVVQIKQVNSTASCSSGTDPFSPCLQVFVFFATDSTDRQAVIMENEQALLNCQQCSYTFGRHSWLHTDVVDCGSWKENFDVQSCIDLYLQRYGSFNQSYPCFFNPLNHNQVVHDLSLNLNMIIHGYVWPILFCVAYGCACVVAFHIQTNTTKLKKKMLKQARHRGSVELKREWKKNQLNKCLGISSTSRKKSQQQELHESVAAFENLTASQLVENNRWTEPRRRFRKPQLHTLPETISTSEFGILGEVATDFEQHEDMRHLDLAVTEQNIDEIANTYAYNWTAQHTSTFPRKDFRNRQKSILSWHSTLPASLKQSKSTENFKDRRHHSLDFWNSSFEQDFPNDSAETVSITTSNMLTELEIDALYKAHARTKNPILKRKKSETAV